MSSSGGSTLSVKYNTGRGFSSTTKTWSGVNTSGDGTAGWNALQGWDDNGTSELYATNQGTERAKEMSTGAASRLRTSIKARLHHAEHPNSLPASYCCPGSPSVALEFFTLTTQFAFGQGCDRASYVAPSFSDVGH